MITLTALIRLCCLSICLFLSSGYIPIRYNCNLNTRIGIERATTQNQDDYVPTNHGPTAAPTACCINHENIHGSIYYRPSPSRPLSRLSSTRIYTLASNTADEWNPSRRNAPNNNRNANIYTNSRDTTDSTDSTDSTDTTDTSNTRERNIRNTDLQQNYQLDDQLVKVRHTQHYTTHTSVYNTNVRPLHASSLRVTTRHYTRLRRYRQGSSQCQYQCLN